MTTLTTVKTSNLASEIDAHFRHVKPVNTCMKNKP